jgi:hypothetical protein
MQKWQKENWSLIGRSAKLTTTGRAVVEDESGKMTDQKMQEKTAKMIDITGRRLEVVRCIGYETFNAKVLKWKSIERPTCRHPGEVLLKAKVAK